MKERDRITQRLMYGDDWRRVFRANSGRAWAGRVVEQRGGQVLLDSARPFAGMPEGFPDICGWESIEITTDMVGQRVAVFVAEEVKVNRGRLTQAQKTFRDILIEHGGIHRVIREDD